MKTATNFATRRLSAATLADFLAFFDHDAFADNPRWQSCYCQFLHVDHDKIQWHERTLDENRSDACTRVQSGEMQGYLAYADGRVVGWCNATPWNNLAALADENEPDAARIGAITCFVIAAPWRRQSVATTLLRAACAGLAEDGYAFAVARPQVAVGTAAEMHFGPLAMFLAEGFAEHRRDDDGNVYVRKALTP